MGVERSLPVACATLVGTLLLGANAGAYCRTTTCDAEKEACTRDPQTGCVREGNPLYWPEQCVTFGVQQDASPLRGISYDQAGRTVQRAFQAWISADCGGQHPFLGISPRGPVACDVPEFNKPAHIPNANVVMFRDDGWPYDNDYTTLALTTITFTADSGAILDADIELNSFEVELTATNGGVQMDLESILTHEVGHFLGLAHSKDERATMYESYRPTNTEFRTLEPDDEAGICAMYPPSESGALPSCNGANPPHGFARECGNPDRAQAGCSCTLPGRESSPVGAAWALGAALALGATSRRRQRRR